jgi:hypothetical protein
MSTDQKRMNTVTEALRRAFPTIAAQVDTILSSESSTGERVARMTEEARAAADRAEAALNNQSQRPAREVRRSLDVHTGQSRGGSSSY